MSQATFAVTLKMPADFAARTFSVYATVVITSGSYPPGGFGPLGLQALAFIASDAPPIITHAETQPGVVGSPGSWANSGYVYSYDPATDTLHALVSGTTGDPLQELSGNISNDTIDVVQVFTRF
jgi:hypothetical protein